MSESNDGGHRILSLFPTPLFRGLCPGWEIHNPGLREHILAHERDEPGETISNVGGWHSKQDLLLWGGPDVEALKGWITGATKHMTQVTTGAKGEVSGKLEMNAWANVSRRGAYNKIHHHPNYTWSGVYYVSTGDNDPDQPESGVIEFLDPRFAVDLIDVPGNPFGGKVRVEPAEGLLLLFPAWMYHYVNPFAGDGERISIAFNVRVTEVRPA